MTTFTAADKRQCADRELRQRQHVYARMVAAGKLTQAKMDREIALMESIRNDYAKIEADEEARGRLI